MMHRADTFVRFADCLSGLVLANGGERQQVILTDPTLVDRMDPALRALVKPR
ncbi:MAG: hypothetical protein U0694_07235 [Anaerolineae bacterium]